MKTIDVPLTPAIEKRVKKLARRLRMSPRNLCIRAVTEFVRRQELDEAIARSYERLAAEMDTSLPPDMAENARRLLKRVEW